MTSTTSSDSGSLESRVDAFGWGIFFVMSGAMLLVPGLPDGSWLAGVGVLFLGLSAARAMLGLQVSGFGLAVGAILLIWGAGAMADVAVPWFSVLLVVCGLALVMGQLFRRQAA